MVAVMEARTTVAEPSESVVDDWIRTWRIARLSKDIGGSSLPGLLGRIVEMGPAAAAGMKRYGSVVLSLFFVSDFERDAAVVQKIVTRMPDELRAAFEAYHLAIIRGERCQDWPHKARAQTLGIPSSTYFTRVQNGRRYVAERLPLTRRPKSGNF